MHYLEQMDPVAGMDRGASLMADMGPDMEADLAQELAYWQTASHKPLKRAAASDGARAALRARIKALGISQDECAALVGVSRTILSRMLSGQIVTPIAGGWYWIEETHDLLDRYVESIKVARRYMAQARAELRQRRLPIPLALRALDERYDTTIVRRDGNHTDWIADTEATSTMLTTEPTEVPNAKVKPAPRAQRTLHTAKRTSATRSSAAAATTRTRTTRTATRAL